MKRVIVYCEGSTEETFVNRILSPALYPAEIYLSASSCNGVSKYSRIKKDLHALCRNDRTAFVTTMLDYYALPLDTPGMHDDVPCQNVYDKVEYLERAIENDIGMPNLIPNLMLHEFEALLFCSPHCFAYCGIDSKAIAELCAIRKRAISPEHINTGSHSAPSKRILALYPAYNKVLDGYNIAQDIGLDEMRKQCRHFNQWFERLLRLNEN